MKMYLAMYWALVGLLSLLSAPSHAGISLDITRVVLIEPKKEVSVLVMNQESTIMIQSWVEPFGATAERDVPFAITPPLSSLGTGARQQLRILYQGQGLPTDRESVFWLSVQEVPQKSKDENILQIAVRQRIKLFYRPANLKGNIDQAPAELQWRMVLKDGKPALEVRNDSAFHISFGTVNIKHGASSYPISANMLLPYSSQSFTLDETFASGLPETSKVEFESINDYGELVHHSSNISS